MSGKSRRTTDRLCTGRPRAPGPRMGVRALVTALVLVAGCASPAPKQERRRPTLPVRVVDFPSQTVLFLPHRGPPSEMRPVLRRLIGYMRAKGIRPRGNFLVRFEDDPLTTAAGATRYEVAVPVSKGTRAEPPYEVKTFPARTTAAVEFLHCPFQELSPHYEDLYRWTKGNGYVPDGQIMDVLLVPPGPGVGPAKLRTEVHLPVEPAPGS